MPVFEPGSADLNQPTFGRDGSGLAVAAALSTWRPSRFGGGVFTGAQVYIQGRFDGVTRIGNHVWIGPQVYFDARSLIIEDHVGWGLRSKVLGSAHTGS